MGDPFFQIIEIILHAWKEFKRTGISHASVLCPTCNSSIRFTKVNSDTKRGCDCGRFTEILTPLTEGSFLVSR